MEPRRNKYHKGTLAQLCKQNLSIIFNGMVDHDEDSEFSFK